MTVRPIIFSAPMVRALLAGAKTQTRRIIKPRGQASLFDGGWTDDYVLDPGNAEWRAREVRYAPGDLLYARETCWLYGQWREDGQTKTGRSRRRFDLIGKSIRLETPRPDELAFYGRGPGFTWRPSIHMPRWASRLTLDVADVRVQRLQQITEADARAEGAPLYVPGHGRITEAELAADPGYSNYLCYRLGFEDLWNELHGPGSWQANPWVVAVSFSVHQINVDQLLGQREKVPA